MNRTRFFIKIFALISLAGIASCASDSVQESANSQFQKKFSGNVAQINSGRVQNNFDQNDDKALPKAPASTSRFANANEVIGISGATQYSSANVNTDRFALKKQEDFSPDEQVYANSKANENKLPQDMFDITYNTNLNPPFVYSGIEFDNIKIPDRDYYGVASTLSDKRYVLAGNQILQRNIDNLLAARTKDEIEMSEILIKEQKELKKQQRLAKIFGDEPTNSKSEKSNETNKNKASNAIDDEIHKAIALQIIQQNLSHNNPANGQNNGQNNAQGATLAQNNANNQQRKQ